MAVWSRWPRAIHGDTLPGMRRRLAAVVVAVACSIVFAFCAARPAWVIGDGSPAVDALDPPDYPHEHPAADPPEDVTVECSVVVSMDRRVSLRDYICMLSNHTGRAQRCDLAAVCFDSRGVAHGSDSGRVTVPPNGIGRSSGSVNCGQGYGPVRIQSSLACSGS